LPINKINLSIDRGCKQKYHDACFNVATWPSSKKLSSQCTLQSTLRLQYPLTIRSGAKAEEKESECKSVEFLFVRRFNIDGIPLLIDVSLSLGIYQSDGQTHLIDFHSVPEKRA
jgi:hypothetical protein